MERIKYLGFSLQQIEGMTKSDSDMSFKEQLSQQKELLRQRKQDCEINAAKRLLARIKKEYPRLPICIQDCAGKMETVVMPTMWKRLPANRKS